MMDIKDYDKIKLQFEECSIMLPINNIEKFKVEKIEQLIEAKYNPEDEYNIYIVINRELAEEVWNKELSKEFQRIYENRNIRI